MERREASVVPQERKREDATQVPLQASSFSSVLFFFLLVARFFLVGRWQPFVLYALCASRFLVVLCPVVALRLYPKQKNTFRGGQRAQRKSKGMDLNWGLGLGGAWVQRGHESRVCEVSVSKAPSQAQGKKTTFKSVLCSALKLP